MTLTRQQKRQVLRKLEEMGIEVKDDIEPKIDYATLRKKIFDLRDKKIDAFQGGYVTENEVLTLLQGNDIVVVKKTNPVAE